MRFKIFARILAAFIILPALLNAAETNARIEEWANLLPAAPTIGESAIYTVKRGPGSDSSQPLRAMFRSNADQFSIPLKDDGASGDGRAGDGVYGGVFPAQKQAGYWYCVTAEGHGESARYAVPHCFTVTPGETEYRALWADCWGEGFLTRKQAEEFIETARRANFNAVIVEVRKTGDAYYNSSIEPRGSNLKDPSYDPLGYLIELAHDTSGGKKRLEVHAWIVAYRIAKAKNRSGFPPSPHILGKHPEWASQNYEGKVSHEGSVFLDPGVPQVTDYNIDVCLDLIRKYDVDGVNFDYIRYPAKGWGYNPAALKRFHKLTGRSDRPKPGDAQWLAFLRDQTAHFLRKAYVKMTKIKPELKVSVCSIGWWDVPGGDFSRSDPYASGVQDWARWNREKLLDVNFRMGYKRRANPKHQKQFENWTRFTTTHQHFRFSPIGLGAYLNSVEDTMKQLDFAREHGAAGLVFYSYSGPCREKSRKDEFYRTLQNGAFAQWREPPPMAWKELRPTGIVAGTVIENGSRLDGGSIAIPSLGLETKTDGTGFYAFMSVPEGEHRVTLDGLGIGRCQVKMGAITEFDVISPRGMP